MSCTVQEMKASCSQLSGHWWSDYTENPRRARHWENCHSMMTAFLTEMFSGVLPRGHVCTIGSIIVLFPENPRYFRYRCVKTEGSNCSVCATCAFLMASHWNASINLCSAHNRSPTPFIAPPSTHTLTNTRELQVGFEGREETPESREHRSARNAGSPGAVETKSCCREHEGGRSVP